MDHKHNEFERALNQFERAGILLEDGKDKALAWWKHACVAVQEDTLTMPAVLATRLGCETGASYSDGAHAFLVQLLPLRTPDSGLVGEIVMNLPLAANDNFRSSAIRYVVEPRMVSPSKAARRIGLSLDQFKRHLPDLLEDGFPYADAITGNYDIKLLDSWQDRRSGLSSFMPSASALNAQDVVMQRLAMHG